MCVYINSKKYMCNFEISIFMFFFLIFNLNQVLGKECGSRNVNILHIVLIVMKDNITSHYQGLTFLFTSVYSADINKFPHYTEQEKRK